MSYVLPVTSFAYVLSAVIGAVWLRETVNAVQWAGISVITLGASLVALVVIPGTVGDVLNSLGMRRQGEIRDWSPKGLIRLCRQIAGNGYILAGIPAMAISFFAMMALLSTSKLSFAVPITASSYILETALAKYILKERVGWRRWAGTSLVAMGIALLSL